MKCACNALTASLAALAITEIGAIAQPSIQLTPIGTHATSAYLKTAAEIVAYEPLTQQLFVVNAQAARIDVLDITDPTAPRRLRPIEVSAFGGVANSAAVYDGVIAVAIEDSNKQKPGTVAFYSTTGRLLSRVKVGPLPDMLTFTSDGKWVLVANEGEPNSDYTIDPEGSISIIDMSGGVAKITQANVRIADFTAFNHSTIDPRIRIFGPNATVAQDLEPEYIAVSHDSKTAWVALQENNAIAAVDIESAQVTALMALGFKDHNLAGNGLDASDADSAIAINTWPVKGMYQPDAIAAYRVRGETYLVAANEGDSRDYAGFSEETRLKDLKLDSTAFPQAAILKNKKALGRLKVSNANGDLDSDGDYDEVYSFGGRSFSIWTTRGELVYDSGDEFEHITAIAYPVAFNSNSEKNDSFDDRSDDKGPEPEGLEIAEIGGRTYAFIALERIGGIMVYDISEPRQPFFVQYVNNRRFSGNAAAGTAGDLGPEGLTFIKAGLSPNDKPLLVAANEVSGTTTIFEIEQMPNTTTNSIQKVHFVSSSAPHHKSPRATIGFTLPKAAQVVIKLYNPTGEELAALHDNRYDAGTHYIAFEPSEFPGEVYLYRIEFDGIFQHVGRLTLR